MKKADLKKMDVLELADEHERIVARLTELDAERDRIHAEAMALHEERAPLEAELEERAWVMRDPEVAGGRMTVPRMILNAREAAKAEAKDG